MYICTYRHAYTSIYIQVFAMFDRLMLLTDGGCVYYGPATEAVMMMLYDAIS